MATKYKCEVKLFPSNVDELSLIVDALSKDTRLAHIVSTMKVIDDTNNSKKIRRTARLYVCGQLMYEGSEEEVTRRFHIEKGVHSGNVYAQKLEHDKWVNFLSRVTVIH